jgi:hypothetical protein
MIAKNMRLIATAAFKGTMSPLQAAQYLAHPGDQLLPLSDGGDGFIECLHHGLGGEIIETPAADPFGRIHDVPVLLLADGTAVLECAKVIGLAGLDRLVGPAQRFQPRTRRSVGAPSRCTSNLAGVRGQRYETCPSSSHGTGPGSAVTRWYPAPVPRQLPPSPLVVQYRTALIACHEEADSRDSVGAEAQGESSWK